MKNKKMPDGWNNIKLKSVLLKSESGLWGEAGVSNDIPVLRSTNIRNNGRLSYEKVAFRKFLNKNNMDFLEYGDILIEKSGGSNDWSVGRVVYFDKTEDNYYFANFMHRIRVNPEKAFWKYIFYYLFDFYKKGGTKSLFQKTTGIQNLRISEYLLQQISLPSLFEQHKITDIISSIDAVIDKTQAIINQTEILKKGLMQELFTRGIPGIHKKFKKTEIGEIPERWEVKAVKELISLCQYGLNKPLSSEPIGIPILRMNNLSDGEINIEDIKYAVLTKEEEHEFLLEQDNLLFNRTNSQALVGKVAIYKGNKKMAFASYLLRLKAKPDKTDSKWLNYYFNTDEIQDKLRHLATPGVSQSNINAKIMQTLKFRTPPLKEQEEISNLIDIICERLNQENIILKRLNEAKSALMQVLLTGDIRVKI